MSGEEQAARETEMTTTANRPTLTLTAGSPGAGKGYVIENVLAAQPVVDCDAWKAKHPDYDPKNPSAVHAWSSEMASREFFERLSLGEDFIYDGTGGNTEKYVQMIQAAQAAGFETKVVYVKVSLPTAIARNAQRERTVPEDLLRQKFAEVQTSVEILTGYVDTVQTIVNE